MATRGRKPSLETQVARAAVAALRETGAVDKPMPKVKARYDAAGNGRRMAGWNPPSGGPNASIDGLSKLRSRARDSSRNDWSGRSGIQKWTTNLIGIGITPRFKRITNKARKLQIIDLFDDFVSECDADGVLNFYGLQTLVVRTWLDGGEAFVRKRVRFPDSGLAVPLQLQVLESDMLPLLDADTYTGLPQNNVIRSGVELDRRGQRVAYWFYKQHPGDQQNAALVDAKDLVRVAASEVCHIYEPERPGQLRGVSMLAPVLGRLRTIENYDDATLTRQQLANLVVAFITRKLPPMTGDEDLNGLTGEPFDYEEGTGSPLVGLQPGLVQELEDGQDVNWSNPPEAGTNYSDYMRTQHMGTSAAAGLPYEVFSGDIRNVSDRTLRVVINEFRRFAEQRQWQIIIPQFCQKAMRWFAEGAAVAGRITVAEIDPVRRAEWSPHGWAHIHPTQDPQGKLIEVEAGFRSRSSVIAEMGDDPDMVDEERAADREREEALGIGPIDPATGQMAVDESESDNADDNPDGEDDNADDPQQNAMLNELRASHMALLNAQTAALASKPAPAEPVQLTINNHIPQTVVNNEVAPTPVTVENHVAAPNVTVENSVSPTPVAVNVAPANVEIRNEVPPAEVTVNLPNRKTETTVVRDAKGNIVKTTQLETDAE